MQIINRTVRTPERMLEIIESMPKPIVAIKEFTQGVPSLTIHAHNLDGVCFYRYQASGLISISSDKKNLIPFIEKYL